ncbi:unnamed protein product, partial [Heterosigma akashiwo]
MSQLVLGPRYPARTFNEDDLWSGSSSGLCVHTFIPEQWRKTGQDEKFAKRGTLPLHGSTISTRRVITH